MTNPYFAPADPPVRNQAAARHDHSTDDVPQAHAFPDRDIDAPPGDAPEGRGA
ncbi:hypothetical protein ACFROC_08270 [Nocardia tengchongensis]|uniref:hypothetical protein n=1 Tax=Nocardia tengchongensis TaxID=2055889 RepID=UPI0036BD9D2B